MKSLSAAGGDMEIDENNRMGKTGNLFKKIKDIKGIVHARMDMKKDRNI